MGAPKGNQNAAKGRMMSKTLQKRLEERDAMKDIVDALITKAIDGDLPAIKETFDRMDGKAPQEISAEINDNTERSADNLDIVNRLAFLLRRGYEAASKSDSDGGDADMGSSTGSTGDGLLH